MTRVLFNKVLVKLQKPEEKQGNLYLPNKDIKRNEGIVKGIGDEVKHVREGDKVTFNQYAANVIDDELVILKEEDVFMVME